VGAGSPKALNVFEVFSDFVTFFYPKRRALKRTLSSNEQDVTKINSKPHQNMVA
jgi:hypothetical protein